MTTQQIRVRRQIPHWLDNATRDRALAVMAFDAQAGTVDLGHLSGGVNTVRTLAVGDHLDIDGTTWQVTEIRPGDRGWVALEAR